MTQMQRKIGFTADELTEDLEILRTHGRRKGKSTGFTQVDQFMTWKSGTTVYFYGMPFSGKSELIFEFILQGIELYGWNVAIFSPETGTGADILAELISKKLRKPLYRDANGCMSDSEMYRAKTELSQHLYIIDPGYDSITLNELFSVVSEGEKKLKRIHLLVIDPWNELKHDFGRTNREDVYLEEALARVRRNAQEKKRINIISTHIADLQQHMEKGIRYYPQPSPNQLAGGRTWYRKGMNMISVWRPPYGLEDHEGRPYEKNEVHLTIQKYKPKGVGQLGTVRLYYCPEANRHYQINENGTTREFPGASSA